MPVVSEVTMTPMASADAESTAMAASALTRLLSAMRSRKNAASMTTGIENHSGAKPQASATASAPKLTWLSPSPIIE